MADALVGILLALPGIIDLCITYGARLERTVKLFKNSDDHIKRHYFVLSFVQNDINYMLRYFIDRPDQLDLEFAIFLVDWTEQLQTYRKKAIAAFPAESTAGTFAVRAKFAVINAKRLATACDEMEEWYKRFSRRANNYKTFKMQATPPASIADNGSNRTPFQRGLLPSPQTIQTTLLMESADPNDFKNLSNSSLWVPIPSKTSSQTALEYRTHRDQDQGEVEVLAALVREVASRLSAFDASFTGLLRCKGFSHEIFQEHFTLHFEIPEGMVRPKSLRTLLADPINKSQGRMHSISDRISLAKAIASAVLYMHICGFVHKNIQPENIIIFESATRDSKWPFVIGTPFLVGYDGVRQATADSKRLETTEWQKRIYLAPGRLNMTQNDKFHMRHDVYSLGVVLLEIALWKDFTDDHSPIGSKLKARDPVKILHDESQSVSIILGDKYHSAVKACLNELREEKALGVLNDSDGIVQGRAYMDQVMSHLEDITV